VCERQAGAEIEVTPEMIQAGVDASFEDFIWDEDDREVCVESIIRAALETSDQSR